MPQSMPKRSLPWVALFKRSYRHRRQRQLFWTRWVLRALQYLVLWEVVANVDLQAHELDPGFRDVPHWRVATTTGDQALFDGFPRPTAKDYAALDRNTTGHVMFREIGILAGATTWGHLIFSTNLSYVPDMFARAESMMTKAYLATKKVIEEYDEGITKSMATLNKNPVIELVIRKKEKLGRLALQWKSYQSTFVVQHSVVRRDTTTRHSELAHKLDLLLNSPTADALEARERQKRMGPIIGIIIAIGAALGTLFGVFNTVQLASLKAQVADKNGKTFIIDSIQENRDRILQLENSVNLLTGQKDKFVQMMILYGAQAVLESHLEDIYQAAEDEVNRLTTSLDQLLDSRLSPQLVEHDQLRESMDKLKLKASRYSFVPPVEETGFIYQLPVSFLCTEGGMLSVFLHVPLLKASETLRILRFHNMPMVIPGSKLNVQIQPEGDLLAVNAETDGFIVLQNRQLDACEKLGKLHLCTDTNFIMKNFDQWCLSSIYLTRSTAAQRMCPTVIVPPRVIVNQISATSFYIFHPEEISMDVDCAGLKTQHHRWRGANLIELFRNCHAHSDSYSLHAHEEFGVNATITPIETVWKLGRLLSNISLPVLNYLLPEPPRVPVPVEDLKSQYWEIENRQMVMPWSVPFGLSLLSFLGLTGTAISILICFRGPLLACLGAAIFRAMGRGNPDAAEGIPLVRRHRRPSQPAIAFEEEEQDGFVVARVAQEPPPPPAYSPSTGRSRSPRSLYKPLAQAAHAVAGQIVARVRSVSPALRRAGQRLRSVSPRVRRAVSPLLERGRQQLRRLSSRNDLSPEAAEIEARERALVKREMGIGTDPRTHNYRLNEIESPSVRRRVEEQRARAIALYDEEVEKRLRERLRPSAPPAPILLPPPPPSRPVAASRQSGASQVGSTDFSFCAS